LKLIHNLSFDNKNTTNNKFDKIVQINITQLNKERPIPFKAGS